ncbi:haloacid dehalogenase [Lojkania enalia]|uniref:Haloacid dehalogenase n=1 Tax=Lojkania enalia TaxID=147567 RepID=A0A9P4K890_9PLEO|nr:haloacid dehalogenase [Didymosphaeria enalia]
MPSQTQIILAFDVYGTLLSTESIAKQLASHFGTEKANSIAQEWRKYQLEYTWRLNSMNRFQSFSDVTRNSLKHALAETGDFLGDGDIDGLMKAYNNLSVFPDVPPLFSQLQSTPNITATIFSNGASSMISATLSESPDISPYAKHFKDVVVVEEVRKFKPHPDVYHHLCERVGKKGSEADVWLVSSNPFDVVGANSAGMSTCWVDRSGKGWMDGLVQGEKGKPTIIAKGVGEVVKKGRRHFYMKLIDLVSESQSPTR